MSFLAELRKYVARFYQFLSRFEAATPSPVALPTPHLEAELTAFLRSMDQPDDSARGYLEIHIARIVRTLSMTPTPSATGRVLELGAYMHMTPALECVLGYREVRAAYFGPLGRTDPKTVTVNGNVVFRCVVDHFDAERDRYPYSDAHFDAVLACEIFEHFLHDPMHMLTECRRVLADGGALVLTTPNIASYTGVARVLEQSANPQLYSKYPNPAGENAETEIPHVREYTPQELSEVLEAAGFKVDYLFTEIAPGYHAHVWVEEFLKNHRYPAHLRGEQMYCLARKVSDASVTRFPPFLYDV